MDSCCPKYQNLEILSFNFEFMDIVSFNFDFSGHFECQLEFQGFQILYETETDRMLNGEFQQLYSSS